MPQKILKKIRQRFYEPENQEVNYVIVSSINDCINDTGIMAISVDMLMWK